MYIINAIKRLTWYEKLLWSASLLIIMGTFFIFKNNDFLTLIASLAGVTALIFVAKGDVLGQAITVIFSIFYAIVSFHFRYWGEMITYLCMTAPIAAGAVYTWLKNPYAEGEVRIREMKKKNWFFLSLLTIVVTIIFGIILKLLHTPNLFFSTLSIATSFFAASLVLLRSEYYGLGYAANDIVLIILWILATQQSIQYLPMVLCFFIFLINDIYGFFNWKNIKNKQE